MLTTQMAQSTCHSDGAAKKFHPERMSNAPGAHSHSSSPAASTAQRNTSRSMYCRRIGEMRRLGRIGFGFDMAVWRQRVSFSTKSCISASRWMHQT